jgi:hypothetical protein
MGREALTKELGLLIALVLCIASAPAYAQCPAECAEVASGAFGPICWCLGAPGTSCTSTCSALGGSCDLEPLQDFAGAPGGSSSNCATVLDALAVPAGTTFESGCDADPSGASGCAFGTNTGTRFLCSSPPTTCEQVPTNTVRRACSCTFEMVGTPALSSYGLASLVALLVGAGAMRLGRRRRALR